MSELSPRVSEPFWIEDPSVLLSIDLVPDFDAPLPTQLNTFTRLACILAGVLYAMHYKYTPHALGVAISILLIIYWLELNMGQSVSTEGFTYLPLQDWKQIPSPTNLKLYKPTMNRFCLDGTPVTPNASFYSTNQALVEQSPRLPAKNADLFLKPTQSMLQMPNLNAPPYENSNRLAAQSLSAQPPTDLVGLPLTRAKPLNVAPCFATDYWSEDFVVPRNINSRSNQELYQNGYMESEQTKQRCGPIQGKLVPAQKPVTYHVPAVQPGAVMIPEHVAQMGQPLFGPVAPQQQSGQPEQLSGMLQQFPQQSSIEHFTNLPSSYTQMGTMNHGNGLGFGSLDAPGPGCTSGGCPPTYTRQLVEQQGAIQEPHVLQNALGNLSAPIYTPGNLQHFLPSNQHVGAAQQMDVYNDYNRNLYTQSLDSGGLYNYTQMTVPANGSLGIAYAQQFPPTQCQPLDNEGRMIVSEDPMQARPVAPIQRPPEASAANIYDPRFTGYGSADRSYVDPMTGQPRFYYDDVDVIRRPNYIGRSDVDHAPWAQSAGPLTEASLASLNNAKALANKDFLDSTQQLRMELQERYMRKYNTEIGPQRRMAPIRTNPGQLSRQNR